VLCCFTCGRTLFSFLGGAIPPWCLRRLVQAETLPTRHRWTDFWRHSCGNYYYVADFSDIYLSHIFHLGCFFS
jgi:hypothetical protein